MAGKVSGGGGRRAAAYHGGAGALTALTSPAKRITSKVCNGVAGGQGGRGGGEVKKSVNSCVL